VQQVVISWDRAPTDARAKCPILHVNPSSQNNSPDPGQFGIRQGLHGKGFLNFDETI
jgi:hypothetical protein